jgi:hypothetical protein
VEGQSHHERAARGARTQSLFRDVNERVKEIHEAFSHVLPLADWICECASDDCTQQIAMTSAEYEKVRALPTRFAVVASDSHVVPDIEDVVERHERYWIVEKRDEAAELATLVDPRRGELGPSEEQGVLAL